MSLRSTPTRFGSLARSLHWLIAIGIIAQYFLAEAAEDNEGGSVFAPFPLHASIGVLILALAIVRLAWRAIDERPAWPATMKTLDIAIARVVHIAFYVLLFAVPLTGWLVTSAEGEPIRFFGLFAMPMLPAFDEEMLEEAHEVMFNILVILAAVHALAGLKHHFLDRDNVLRSMLPGPSTRSS